VRGRRQGCAGKLGGMSMGKKLNPMAENLILRENISKLCLEMDKMRADSYTIKGFTVQQCLDMACIALHESFGFGAERLEVFVDEFHDVFVDYAETCVEDAKDDEEIWYTKEKVDGALRAALGDKLIPFDERYDFDRLYTIDSRELWRGVGMTRRKSDE